MDNEAIRPLLVEATLDLLPPRIRRELLDDKLFIEQWGIPTVTSLTLGSSGPTFRRDQFYSAIRKSIGNPGVAFPINDFQDAAWEVLTKLQGESFSFSVSGSNKHYAVVDHSALAEDSAIRTAWLLRVAPELNLEDSTCREWLARLRDAPLTDDEFAKLMADIQERPVSIYRTLQTNMQQSSIDVATLVPTETRYYERLIGPLGSAATVEEYLEAGAKPLIADLQRSNSLQGFLYALLPCSLGKIAGSIQIRSLSRTELIEAYQWVIERGDPISRIGAAEVAISHLDTHPELASFIEQIVEDLIAIDPGSESNDIELLSSTIIMMASKLGRKRSLGNTPPFYRRQAAIAHASLIVRAIHESRIDPGCFTQWIQNFGFSHSFFLQGLVDLRREPRWLPGMIGADQLRAEFVGRIVGAVAMNEDKIQTHRLKELLVGQDSKLASSVQWPLPMLPGPLEGATVPEQKLPDEIFKEVKGALEGDQLEVDSFIGFFNTAVLFNLPEGYSSLATDALRRARFSVESTEDCIKSFELIHGLATVAAVTRNTDLASAVRILTRVLRRRNRLNSNASDELRIAMIAAASFEDIEEWARFSGEWITEMAFEACDEVSAEQLARNLRHLIQIEPALAPYCTPAEAALSAVGF